MNKEDFLLCIVIFIVLSALIVVIGGMCWLSEKIHLDFTIKKIEMLQEKELINNETMQILIQDLQL